MSAVLVIATIVTLVVSVPVGVVIACRQIERELLSDARIAGRTPPPPVP